MISHASFGAAFLFDAVPGVALLEDVPADAVTVLARVNFLLGGSCCCSSSSIEVLAVGYGQRVDVTVDVDGIAAAD